MKRFSVILIVVLLLPLCASAHKLSIFTEEEDGFVAMEVFFQDGTPCRLCEIEITDNSGKKTAAGKTDDNGFFRYEVNGGTISAIAANAGAGHRGEIIFTSAETEKREKKVSRPAMTKIIIALAAIFMIFMAIGRLKRK